MDIKDTEAVHNRLTVWDVSRAVFKEEDLSGLGKDSLLLPLFSRDAIFETLHTAA